MEDSELIELYWTRNEAAITQSAMKYGSYCYTIAMNILSNHEDAEECVNDTWLRAWNAIPPERPNVFRAWIGKITLNLSFNRWQKNRSQKRYAGIEEILSELEACIPAGQSTEQQIEANEITRILNAWLSTLCKEDRGLFVRRYWYGDSVKKLAIACGISPEKTAKRLFVLRNKLKVTLEKEGIFV